MILKANTNNFKASTDYVNKKVDDIPSLTAIDHLKSMKIIWKTNGLPKIHGIKRSFFCNFP